MAKGEVLDRKRDATPPSATTAEARRGLARPRATGAGLGRDLDENRIGVVFVHGIGTQAACETFLDWSGSIVRVLTDWRTEHGFGLDPVVRCEYDLSGARLPILEAAVPAYDGHPAQTWVMTEAWWADRTRDPSLTYMTSYVSHAMGPIMAAIRCSYGLRREEWQQQRSAALASAAAAGGSSDQDRLVARAVREPRFDWVDILDRIQKDLTILAFGPALVLGHLALLFYAPFRAIPISALQNAAALKSIDNFLTRWFGELPDITRDPIQAANVRTQLVTAIRGLRSEGCGRIVVVAHSGGAIVSFETLCDPAFRDVAVDKLVTLGEGLALAWRIDSGGKGPPRDSRLAGDLQAMRPNLLWADFWATYDPAAAGPLDPPPGVCLSNRSSSTINRMSLLEDHGSYWDNDEEFMIPLLRNIDVPTGPAENSRFFRDGQLGTVRLAWRRQRVGVLALWRWLATLGAAIPIAVATVRALLGAAGIGGLAPRPGPERLGADIAGAWSHIPGHEIIAGPLDGLSGVAAWPGVLPLLGEWLMATLVVAAAFVVLARVGVGRWEAWDLSARIAARKRVPQRIGQAGPLLTFAALTAIDVAMAAATLWLFWR